MKSKIIDWCKCTIQLCSLMKLYKIMYKEFNSLISLQCYIYKAKKNVCFRVQVKKNRVGRLGIFFTIFYVHTPIIKTFYWNLKVLSPRQRSCEGI